MTVPYYFILLFSGGGIMEIQWYPGHMAKARKIIKQNIRLVDAVIELVDARAPLASHLPDLDELSGGAQKIVVLNKADLADERVTGMWIKKFREIQLEALDMNSMDRHSVKRLINLITTISCKKPGGRPTRCMIIGIPNVGKSSVINQMAGRKGARTGDIPGVTKGKMWLKVNKELELLDTPGILWPKFEDKATGIKLAILGSIKEELINIEELSCIFLEFLSKEYPHSLRERYKIDVGKSPREMLNDIAFKRGFLMVGGVPDMERSAKTLLMEYRQGKLGRISLENPDEQGGFWQNISNQE
ncbi:MAG: ribosome biosis GTPase [Thermoanaerobacteraceae bacterium]|jgi:ribosome biogenesis GTPase A|nr:ribosome biosis GTPase [Thermoanaerobacteraceae bacterium]